VTSRSVWRGALVAASSLGPPRTQLGRGLLACAFALFAAGCCCGPPRVRLGGRSRGGGLAAGLAKGFGVLGGSSKRLAASPGGKLCQAWSADPRRPRTSGLACLPSGVCSCGWGADEGTTPGPAGFPNRIEFSVETDTSGRIKDAYVLADINVPSEAPTTLAALERDAGIFWSRRHLGKPLPPDAASAIRAGITRADPARGWTVERHVFGAPGGYRVVFRTTR
jgi:hypothetical protein